MTKPLAFAGLLLTLTGCQFNIFDPLDSPGGDAQLKSAGDACLDRRDYECAAANYAKLAELGGNSADVANSRLAFTILDQNNAGFGAIASGFGTGGASLSALNPIVRSVYSGAGLTKRHALYTAYQKVALINDTSLKNLTRFLTAVALAAEFLAESADSDGVLRKTSLLNSPSTCTSANAATVSGPCGAPAGVKFSATSGASIVTTEPTATTLTYDTFHSAINEAVQGLTGIGVSGGFTSTLSSFNAILNFGSATTTSNGNLYREALVIENGLGE